MICNSICRSARLLPPGHHVFLDRFSLKAEIELRLLQDTGRRRDDQLKIGIPPVKVGHTLTLHIDDGRCDRRGDKDNQACRPERRTGDDDDHAVLNPV